MKDRKAYLIKRVLYTLMVLCGVSIVTFILTHLIGDPVKLILPVDVSHHEYDRVRHLMGFDRPIYIQLWDFISNAVRGDFGDSIWQTGRPALAVVLERLPNSIILGSAAMTLAIVIGVPLGVLSAVKEDTIIGKVINVISYACVSIADFWLAIMLVIVFSVNLGWFDTSGFGFTFKQMTLPTIALATRPIGRIIEVLRSEMLEVMQKQYVSTARAKGLPFFKVVTRHTLRNALVPLITIVSYDFVILFVGDGAVVETVFSWPGMGKLSIEALMNHDFTIIQSIVLIAGLAVGIINFLTDIAYVYLNPKVELN